MREILNLLKWALRFSVNITLSLLAVFMIFVSICGVIANIREKNIYGVIVSISFFIVALLIFKIT